MERSARGKALASPSARRTIRQKMAEASCDRGFKGQRYWASCYIGPGAHGGTANSDRDAELPEEQAVGIRRNFRAFRKCPINLWATTGLAVMKINSRLGYEPGDVFRLTKDRVLEEIARWLC